MLLVGVCVSVCGTSRMMNYPTFRSISIFSFLQIFPSFLQMLRSSLCTRRVNRVLETKMHCSIFEKREIMTILTKFRKNHPNIPIFVKFFAKLFSFCFRKCLCEKYYIFAKIYIFYFAARTCYCLAHTFEKTNIFVKSFGKPDISTKKHVWRYTFVGNKPPFLFL